MNLHEWNTTQIDIALGEVNRYFFHLHFGRNAKNDDELMLYYAEYGASIFAHLHQGELDEKRTNKTPPQA